MNQHFIIDTENLLYLCQNDKHLFQAVLFIYSSGIFSPTNKETPFPVPNMGYSVQEKTPARRPLVWRAVELIVPIKVDTETDEEVLIPLMEWDSEPNVTYIQSANLAVVIWSVASNL